MNLKGIIKPFLPPLALKVGRAYKALKPSYRRQCPICTFYGFFSYSGRPPRLDACCPQCESLERHRLFWLWFTEHSDTLKQPILHFAPEAVIEQRLRKVYDDYKTADLFQRADYHLDLERIDVADSVLQTVICNHVLEHVDDEKALREISRILSPTGILVASVPIVEGWDKTYEDSNVTDPSLREVHFGQSDHIRYYGRDFRDRLRAAGFLNVEEITATGTDVIKYSLLRGEKIFICRKGEFPRPSQTEPRIS